MSIITLKGVSKKFQMYRKPTDRLKEMILRRPCHEAFWALQDIDFAVEKGTTTGLVGVNGSGKSTILQLVAGTLTPTSGTITANGRIAALLELGAGFNPEFSGRENVFMNGALMGLDERAMADRFAEIARFAEIGDFIDRPVKTYSSGMYVRLAFATAIHLDPDILLVDEALAVGDIAFQHRCLRKIKELQASGVTILFVSHDMGAVKSLCDQAVLVSGGRIIEIGEPDSIIKRYTAQVMGDTVVDRPPVEDSAIDGAFRHGDQQARIERVTLLSEDGQIREIVGSGDPVVLRVRIKAIAPINEPVVGLMIRNRLGTDVYGTNTEKLHQDLRPLSAGESATIDFAFPIDLVAGGYSVTVAVHSSDLTSHDWIDEALYVEVINSPEAIGIAHLHAEARVQYQTEVIS